ncbi:MAG: DUF3769 domain-containing protein [Oscillatoriaceae bacterium SKW80]|nr:DUF3769 domain-containing protein [Oscillatoriaceae bacterium SKYG93]MCX8122370.1 DUF3769 domain-containing protein [Oscillatoriaceae bacterium SKW80]MDW8452478.1 DUF3769 domain-containing protein [Oscillatoriaceae cyanobacterium SKYGB_i_bin93]HIK27757.1 DUF3769 domain-containing protein [Oscillatoriaceae cyanobacterium M7585_C2015_266]
MFYQTPESPSLVYQLPQRQVSSSNFNLQVREAPRLQASGLPELQRRSRASALLPPSIVAVNFEDLPSGALEIRVFQGTRQSQAAPEFLAAYYLPKLESKNFNFKIKNKKFYTLPTIHQQIRQQQSPAQMPLIVQEDVVELTAERQEYDERRQILTAEGNVLMRYRNSVLNAERVQVNFQSRTVVAQGNVAWSRGEQVLRGERIEYNFVQGVGTVIKSSGELYLPTSGADFSPTLPTDVSATSFQEQPLSDRITSNQPLENVVSPPGGVTVTVGSGFTQKGQLRRIRYEAERVDFTPEGGVAKNIRLTNDPFSPPELELRAPQARFRRISPFQDEIRATNPRLVFDQGLSLPFYPNRIIIDKRAREPSLFRFGYDRQERGGLFVESPLEPVSRQRLRLRITPQFYIQRALENGFDKVGELFGFKVRLNANLGLRTTAIAFASFRSFDFNNLNDMRASLRVNQAIPTPIGTHSLTGEYSYRDRLFNGSLGFQTVQRSVGAVLTSPVIPLGKTGINFSYQVGLQQVEADSDRLDLLNPVRDHNRLDLTRFQASAALSRGFHLWKGKSLPATATEGLRYTSNPVFPYLQLLLGLRGVTSHYSNGERQSSLTGSVGLLGQFGHFSRPWFDYTGFNLTYTQVLQDGSSPFLFDRVADVRVLGAGITQQIYGPFRFGLQTAFNLDTGREINTDYIFEYSRRTYGIILRYNPVREIGSLTLRISDFNWNGGGEPFSGADVRTVEAGVRRD